MIAVSHRTNNIMLIGEGLHIDDVGATRTRYEDGSYAMITYWKPNTADLELLNSNGLIKLHILTPHSPPPVAIEVSTP